MAASIVVYRDGHIKQRHVPASAYNDSRIWGSTLGASTVVARSRVGVTATGALADPSHIAATKLYPRMQRRAGRYLGPPRNPGSSSPSRRPEPNLLHARAGRRRRRVSVPRPW